MKTNMILVFLIGMISVSFAQPSDKKEKKSKYGKVLFTKESFKDTTSELSYTVYEKMHRNAFGVKKEVVTVEYDLAKFIRENKDLNTGPYDEKKFQHACCTLKDDVTRSYWSGKIYLQLNADFSFRDHFNNELYGFEYGLWFPLIKRLFVKEMWIRIKIIDDPMLEECSNIGEILPYIEREHYGNFYVADDAYAKMELIVIALLRIHKLGYSSYPEKLNYNYIHPSACK